jgi:hypothetical protein
MAATELLELVQDLNADEQERLRKFIAGIKASRAQLDSAFERAFQEFVAEHSELLQRLAK